jgi:hypothetical protein
VCAAYDPSTAAQASNTSGGNLAASCGAASSGCRVAKLGPAAASITRAGDALRDPTTYSSARSFELAMSLAATELKWLCRREQTPVPS